MKELNIEEKAKRYDEIIKRAKEKYAMFEGMKQGDVLEDVFPELKESEDEKTRKEILDYIIKGSESLYDVQQYGEEIFEKWIAWLEKQGEQKPVECCADKLWTEFQKQVAYLMASSYNREYEYTKGYVEWVAQSLLGYAKNEIEQKPAEWSWEDRKHLEGCLQYFATIKEDSIFYDDYLWLKSLKDRVQLQPKQEWSDEDEEMLSCISGLLEEQSKPNYNGSTFWTKEQLTRWNNWLKSLRPQKQWKPTEKHISYLEDAIGMYEPSEANHAVLEDLLDQLKAL